MVCVCIFIESYPTLPLSALSLHIHVQYICKLSGGPVSCADALRSPEERAASQAVEAMRGEVPPQQQEQAEPTRGAAQPHPKEERYVGWLHVHIYAVHECLSYSVQSHTIIDMYSKNIQVYT